MGNAPSNDVCTSPIPLNTTSGSPVFAIGDEFKIPIEIQPGEGTNRWALESAPQCIEIGDPPGDPTGDPPPLIEVRKLEGIIAQPDSRYGVWYTLKVANACKVDVTLSTCGEGTNFDTAISVYKGKCESLECVAGADDTCGGNSVQTLLNVEEPDDDGTETYYILVQSGNDDFDPNFLLSFTLQGTVSGTTVASCGGDPHFVRWNQKTRDSFHGECDLVLLHSDSFHDGNGLDVHVRTTMQNDFSYSYVEAVAVRLGTTILEFHPKVFKINGVDHDYDAVSSFSFQEKEQTYEISSAVAGKHKRDTTLNLNQGASIKIRSSRTLMYVSFQGGKADFGDSVGMLGNYTTGEMVGRFGAFKGDYVSYGFEWQVNPNQNDPILFSDVREPQLPYERCRLPAPTTMAQRRHLRTANSELYAEAVNACNKSPTDFELCVDDVMATGDIDAAKMFIEMI